MNVENERIEMDATQNEEREVEEVSRIVVKSAMKRIKKARELFQMTYRYKQGNDWVIK